MTDSGPGYESRQALRALSLQLGEVRLPLSLPGVDADRKLLGDLLGQLRDYLLPRVARPRAPVLAVLVGATGVGRSTLLNSLVGDVMSPSGVRRPTTRAPVLVHHPADARWFGAGGAGGVLGSLTRTSDPDGPGTLRVIARPAIPPGIALIDAPDCASAVPANRAQSDQLRLAADLLVFVTSPSRYADVAQTELLESAAARNAAGVVVLNRVRHDDVDEVRREVADRLTRNWLKPPPLFVIEQTTLTSNGLLPQDSVGALRSWLAGVAGTAMTRTAVVRQTLDGIIRGLPEQVARVADAVDAQAEAANRLRLDVRKAYDEAVRYVETAGPLTDAAAPVVIAAAADRAEERVANAWRSMPAGTVLLGLDRPVPVPARNAATGVAELMNVERMRYERLLDDLHFADPTTLQLREAAAFVDTETTGMTG